MFESSTGDSRNDDGLSPGGIVTHGDLEIGSFAGIISLYLAPPVAAAPSVAESERESGRVGSSPFRRRSEWASPASIVGIERVSVVESVREKREVKREG